MTGQEKCLDSSGVGVRFADVLFPACIIYIYTIYIVYTYIYTVYIYIYIHFDDKSLVVARGKTYVFSPPAMPLNTGMVVDSRIHSKRKYNIYPLVNIQKTMENHHF